uniref:Uncharacterized protein n=1 Tax=Oryza sativa subsp. japonica TaxID=39947 RepID=Q6ZKH2_ORYSJ|nr:hypothetical protein [Oryza sativa Japonica Group]
MRWRMHTISGGGAVRAAPPFLSGSLPFLPSPPRSGGGERRWHRRWRSAEELVEAPRTAPPSPSHYFPSLPGSAKGRGVGGGAARRRLRWRQRRRHARPVPPLLDPMDGKGGGCGVSLLPSLSLSLSLPDPVAVWPEGRSAAAAVAWHGRVVAIFIDIKINAYLHHLHILNSGNLVKKK